MTLREQLENLVKNPVNPTLYWVHGDPESVTCQSGLHEPPEWAEHSLRIEGVYDLLDRIGGDGDEDWGDNDHVVRELIADWED